MRFVRAAKVTLRDTENTEDARNAFKALNVKMLSRDIKRNGEFAFFRSQGTNYQMHFIRKD
jgi:hypothetical protein